MMRGSTPGLRALLLAACFAAAGLRAGELPPPLPVVPDPAFSHAWPEAAMAMHAAKSSRVIAAFAGKSGVDTVDEREKYSLLETMLAGLAGDREAATKAMMTEDADLVSNAWTEGIDFYYAFTLKGQVAKWFSFRDWLDPAYRERMRKGAAAWSASDPRPSLEYVLALEDRDPAVVAFARAQLDRMWRSPAEVRAMADQAAAEKDANEQAFAAYMRRFADAMPQEKPADPAGWMRWLAMLTDEGEIARTAGQPIHAFLIFEEYERRVNPNPHPKYGIGSGPVGTVWSPQVRGMRADARNTDNLRAMRDIAVYLFAEDSGNAEVRAFYRHRLLRAAATYWAMGNGEWDSMAYLGHLTSAWCNLYAYAKDPQVRGAATAVLDLLCTSAARRWWRNAWGGPQARDYGDIGSAGEEPSCGSAGYFSFFFAESPEEVEPEADHLTAILSGYRPPWAVVQLARRRTPLPREEWASQPAYATWLPQYRSRPEFFETTTYGQGWQMGSLAGGSRGDVNGFKILIDRPGKVPATICAAGGPPKNPCISAPPGERIAQRGRAALWLSPVPSTAGKPKAKAWSFQFTFPGDLPRSTVGDWWIVDGPTAWVAIRPFGMAGDPAAAAAVSGRGAKKHGAVAVAAQPLADAAYAGFAVEIGDAASHGDRAGFIAALGRASLDLGRLAEGVAACASSDGHRLAIAWHPAEARISIDGQAIDWSTRYDHWRPAPGQPEAVRLGWFSGALSVTAGDASFTGTYDLAAHTYRISDAVAAGR